MALLVGCTLLAAALTHILPAGEYARHADPVTGREVVVAGTYHRVTPSPVSAFGAVVALPKGMQAAGSVIFFIFLIGGAFGVVERTGALHDGIDRLAARLGSRGMLAILIVCLAFAAGGALENMQEEIIAVMPALLLLTRRLGLDAETAAAASVGSAVVGSALSPINPFQVGIAQHVVQLPALSGSTFRLAVMAIGLGFWISVVVRRAERIRRPELASGPARDATQPERRRGAMVLIVVLLTFVIFVYGVMALGWDFDQEAALFAVMGVAAGVVGGLGLRGTVEAFIDGFRSMTYAAILVGLARAISVVLEQGRIIDTIISALSTPLTSLPPSAAALGMMGAHAALHVPVPSVSGQAVLALPVFAPLADLLGVSRQVAVLAYQYGAGFMEMLTPTNGALVAVLAAAGVEWDCWVRTYGAAIAGMFVLGAIAVTVAVAIGVH